MTDYSTLNIKMCNLRLNILKSGIKSVTEATLNLSWNLIGNSNGETNFPSKLLLINTQASRLSKAFPNRLSVNIKFSKTQFA